MKLHRDLENQSKYEFNLTPESIRNHLQKRKQGGPKWAWNNWIGTRESFGLIPDGYQVD